YIDGVGALRTIDDPINSGVEIPGGLDHVDVTLVPKNDDIYQATKTAVIGLQPNDNYDFSFGLLTEVTININEDDPRLDTVIQTISNTSPKTGIRIEAPADVILTGHASDNEVDGLKRLAYRINSGIWTDLADPNLPKQAIDWSLMLHL